MLGSQLKKSEFEIKEFDLGDLLESETSSRDIYLFTELNRDVSSGIMNDIREINKFDDNEEQRNPNYVREPINLFIDTYGGEVSAGFGIVSEIKRSKTPVHGIVTGNCYSMGVPIISSCHKRLATSYSDFMIHSVSVEMMVGSSVYSYESQVQGLKRSNEKMKRVIIENSKSENNEFLDEILNRNEDYFMSPYEAQSLGLIDECDYDKLNHKTLDNDGLKATCKNNSRKWSSKYNN